MDDGAGLQAQVVGLRRPLNLDLHDDHVADLWGPAFPIIQDISVEVKTHHCNGDPFSGVGCYYEYVDTPDPHPISHTRCHWTLWDSGERPGPPADTHCGGPSTEENNNTWQRFIIVSHAVD